MQPNEQSLHATYFEHKNDYDIGHLKCRSKTAEGALLFDK